MLTNTNLHFNIESAITQLQTLPWLKTPSWDLSINEPTGDPNTDNYRVRDDFAGTPIGDLVFEIQSKIGPIGDTRLRKLENRESYHVHTDIDDRYHLALITNPYALLVDLDNQKNFHIPCNGYLWLMNTSISHTAVNFGEDGRVHLHIKQLLPKVSGSTYQLTFTKVPGKPEQRLWFDSMGLGYINNKIKSKEITGFEIRQDKEVLISTADYAIIQQIINNFTAMNCSADVIKIS